jgi:hypothetical protein
MATIIDRAAALRGLVHRAQELPFRGAHLGAGGRGTGGAVEEEADDEVVAFVYQEAAELVEPEGAVDAVGGCGEDGGCYAADGDEVVW